MSTAVLESPRECEGQKFIYTPLGKGRIVYHLKDGTYLVEFEYGGGRIFRPDELFPHRTKPCRSSEN